MARRRGFRLVELIAVVMVLGILAAITLPKLISTTTPATDDGLKQTLSVMRNAIELYASQNPGTLPGADGTEATFKNDLKPYLHGPFPICSIGAKNDKVKVISTAGALTGDVAPTLGWQYNSKDGEFICNSSAMSSDGATTYDKF